MKINYILFLTIPLLFFSTVTIASSTGAVDHLRTIRVGAYNNPPKVFIDSSAKFAGIFPDLLNYIAAKEKWRLKWIRKIWTEPLSHPKDNHIDIMVDIAYSKKQAAIYDFNQETVFLDWGTLYSRVGFEANSFLDLKGRTIAVMQGGIHTDGAQGIKAILNQFDIDCRLITVKDYATVFSLISSGKADAGVVNRLFGVLHEKNARVIHSPIIFNPINLKFAFPKAAPLTPYLKERIDLHLKVLKNNSKSIYHKIIGHYFSGSSKAFQSNLSKQKISLNLTSKELDWIKQHPVIRIGVDPEFSPFEFFTPNGQYRGMAADYVKLIEKSIGVRFEPIKKLPWKKVVKQAKLRNIDLLPCVGLSNERRQLFIYSKPYLKFPRVIITQADSDIKDIRDLDKKKLAVQINSSHHGYIKEHTTITPLLYDRFQDAMLALSRGEADAVIGNLAVATNTIRKLNLTNLKISGHTAQNPSALAFAVRRDWPILVQLINKALYAIPEEVKIQIAQKWMPGYPPVLELPADNAKVLSLSDSEKTFLKRHPRIRMGIDPNYPPFEWIDPGGEHQGISSDYVRLLQERLGVELQVVPDITWPQILAGARNRKIDLIACVSKTPARRAFLHFTHPYLSFPIVILTRTQTPFISAIGDLYGKKVSVVKDYAPYESLIRDHSAVITSVVNSPLEGLQQVSTGASEAYIGNLAVCTYLMQQHHITNLKVAAPAVGIASTNFSMGVRSDWPELVSILNKALQSITPPERNAIATKWMAVRYEYAVNWGRMMRISGGILGVGVLILSGFFYWNRKLSKEIAVRKTIEIQLKEAKQEAERANKAKSIFLANMSHEIRTPMNAILGYSQLMQHDIGLSSNHKKNLSIINNSGEHLLSLINDILEMSKIEAGRIDIQPSDFDLWALLDDLKMMFYVHANAKKIKLEVYRSKAVPQYIVTDEAKLRQVLINLLGNAIKFTDEGKVSLKTKAYLTPESDVTLNNNSLHLSFIISDTGVGMSSEDLQKIFINFEQTEIGRGREGTGLGLSISREYIRFLGGDISVSSELGKGSTFHVSLTTAMGCAADRPENELSSRIIGIEEKHSFFRILVVDDKSTNRDLLVEILSRVGFEVKEAVNGLQAIELCNTFNPHLVMMDIRMPVMDGVTATQKIKSDSINNKITIIAVSASALEDQRIRVLEHGADAFIRKPFKENVVLEEIKKHLHLNYIYSDTTSATEISNQKTSFDAIKHLPIDLIKKMQLATEGGYHKELLTLIETIDGIDPATANALRRLADEYDYDQLLNQFNAHLE